MRSSVNNLVAIMGGYFAQNAHHLNVNVLNRETLMDGVRASGEVPEPDHPRFRLRGKLLQAERVSSSVRSFRRTFHEAI